jgi:tRNA threonylcarbamoyladenosine biosynthesis protein TsaB
MNYLAIDTSHHHCSVSICVDGRVVDFHQHMPRQQSAELLAAIEQVMDKVALSKAEAASQLDCIAVGQGPGSFVGLRLAISVAQGLGEAWGVAVVAIPTLHLLASQAVYNQSGGDIAATQQGLCWVACDARMGQVYTALFSYEYLVDHNSLPQYKLEMVISAKTVSPLADEIQFFNSTIASNRTSTDHVFAIGNGFEEYPLLAEVLQTQGVTKIADDIPRAAHMAIYMKQVLGLQDGTALQAYLNALQGVVVVPEYIRNNVAAKAKSGSSLDI